MRTVISMGMAIPRITAMTDLVPPVPSIRQLAPLAYKQGPEAHFKTLKVPADFKPSAFKAAVDWVIPRLVEQQEPFWWQFFDGVLQDQVESNGDLDVVEEFDHANWIQSLADRVEEYFSPSMELSIGQITFRHVLNDAPTNGDRVDRVARMCAKAAIEEFYIKASSIPHFLLSVGVNCADIEVLSYDEIDPINLPDEGAPILNTVTAANGGEPIDEEAMINAEVEAELASVKGVRNDALVAAGVSIPEEKKKGGRKPRGGAPIGQNAAMAIWAANAMRALKTLGVKDQTLADALDVTRVAVNHIINDRPNAKLYGTQKEVDAILGVASAMQGELARIVGSVGDPNFEALVVTAISSTEARVEKAVEEAFAEPEPEAADEEGFADDEEGFADNEEGFADPDEEGFAEDDTV
jgi:hypothetical protein